MGVALSAGLPFLALLARAAWVARFPADPTGPVDAEGFHLLAVNVLAGHGFSMAWEAPFCPVSIRTPGYPLFLMGAYALLGSDPPRAVLGQLLPEVLTTALVFALGREVGGRRVGALSGLFYALNGTTQRYTGLLFSENLLLPLVTASLWATGATLRAPSPGRGALAGLLWGLSLLVKPNLQYLVLCVLLLLGAVELGRWMGNVHPRWPSVASALCIAALVLTPWVMRNRLAFGRWMLSTAFEENLARVSAVAALAESEGERVTPWTPTWEAYFGRLVTEAAVRYAWQGDPEAELSCSRDASRHRQVATVAREVLAAHRREVAVAHLRGVTRGLLDPGHRTWYPVLTGRAWETTGLLDDIWVRMGESLRIGAVGDALHALWLERVGRAAPLAGLVWWGLLASRIALWCLGLRGLRRLRGRLPLALLLGGMVAYALLLPGPIAYDRFYVPAIPAVAVLVARGALPSPAALNA